MWLGKTWGWWLGTFYYVYSIFRNANALITIPALVEQFGEPTRGAEYYYVKHGTRIIIHFFLILYFYKGNVVNYFNLGEYPKWKVDTDFDWSIRWYSNHWNPIVIVGKITSSKKCVYYA
jgi:hypothetical protein